MLARALAFPLAKAFPDKGDSFKDSLKKARRGKGNALGYPLARSAGAPDDADGADGAEPYEMAGSTEPQGLSRGFL